MAVHPDWRLCIDFGTAASKASICRRPGPDETLSACIRPLPIAANSQKGQVFAAQSALLFAGDRVRFGQNALDYALEADPDVDVLRSFKTFLGAANLNEALRFQLRRSIDRTSRFSQRQALILYLAYLLRLTDAAIQQESALAPAERAPLRRYAHPSWRDGASATKLMSGLFDEAQSVALKLGSALTAREGVAAEEAMRALAIAQNSPIDARVEAAVFEAQAAAECHFLARSDRPHHILVFDMGAGTTDVTAFELNAEGVLRELEHARRTIMLACDEVDSLIVSSLAQRLDKGADRNQKKRAWRQIAGQSRELKETLFTEGQCDVAVGVRKAGLRLRDFSQSKEFRQLSAVLLDLYATSLNQLAQRAASAGKTEIGVVLAGGGARLPFIQEMTAKTSPQNNRVRKVRVEPVVPDWANDDAFPNGFANVFSQAAISVGGAIAQLRAADIRF